MPRPEAEKTLKDQPHDGAFLLRESQQTPGNSIDDYAKDGGPGAV